MPLPVPQNCLRQFLPAESSGYLQDPRRRCAIRPWRSDYSPRCPRLPTRRRRHTTPIPFWPRSTSSSQETLLCSNHHGPLGVVAVTRHLGRQAHLDISGGTSAVTPHHGLTAASLFARINGAIDY